MAGARAPISRVIVLITLLAFAAIALRGHIPGVREAGEEMTAPTVLVMALMPVLLTVSIVILLAGVIASQRRLPLAMPEPDPYVVRQQWRLGRLGLLVLAVLTAASLIAMAASAVFFVGVGRLQEPGSTPIGSSSASQQVTTPPPDPNAEVPTHLTGTAFVIAAVGAIALVVVALIGMIVIAVAARRTPTPPPLPPAPPAETGVDSLARAAEMGLTAMNAPGQQPRTAIIACYVAMERGLSFDRATAPLASDTPMEVLARAFERGALHDASARELVGLFEEARFSPHAMLEWQRMRAEQLLRIALADLQGEMVVA